MPESPKLVVVTPWYPSKDEPYKAAFVREWTATLGLDPARVLTIHLNSVPEDSTEVVTEFTDEVGRVLYIPVPAPLRTPRHVMARLHREKLLSHAADVLARTQAVHAHVSMPSGWAALAAIPDEVPLTYIEHASYLPTLLKDEVTRNYVGDVVRRANVILTPGAREAVSLRRSFPDYRGKIQSVGNPLNFSRLPLRTEPVSRLDRWLTLSNLVSLKRVDEAIRTFALWHAQNPEAQLTVAGQGAELGSLTELTRSLGVEEVVSFRGAVEWADVPQLLLEHDLLVHLSSRETFAIAPLEGVATGISLLITECGGPEETLFLARQTNQVEFVTLTARAPHLVNVVSRMREALPVTDGPANREILVNRYDAPNFGGRLIKTLDGELPLAAPQGTGGSFAVFEADWTKGKRQILDLFQALLAKEAKCAFVVADKSGYIGLDPRVDLIEIPLPRTSSRIIHFRARLRTAPVIAVVRILRFGAGLVAKLPNPPGRFGRGIRRKCDSLIGRIRSSRTNYTLNLQSKALKKSLAEKTASTQQKLVSELEMLPPGTKVIVLDIKSSILLQSLSDLGVRIETVNLSDLYSELS